MVLAKIIHVVVIGKIKPHSMMQIFGWFVYAKNNTSILAYRKSISSTC
jgi:hypothetical protein